MRKVDSKCRRTLPLDGSYPYTMVPEFLTFYNGISDPEYRTLITLMQFDYGQVTYNDQNIPVFVTKGYCDIALEKIAVLRGINKRTVERHIDHLEELGIIVKDKRTNLDGQRTSDRKMIVFDNLYKIQSELDELKEQLGLKRQNFTVERANSHDRASEDARQIIKDNNKNTSYASVTTPQIYEDSSDTRDDLPINQTDNTLNDFSADFLVGTTRSLIESKSKDTLTKKISSGNYDKLSSRDLLEYFKRKHYETYHMYPSISRESLPKTLSILNSGFLAKYGGKRCLEIIDNMFALYEKAGLKTDQYPRVTIISLTQDWMINKLFDYINLEKEIDKIKEAKKESEEYEDIPGPFTKFEPKDLTPNERDRLKLNSPTPYFWLLARNGYIDKEWFLEHTDPDVFNARVKEAIMAWNRNNQTQLKV
jgi:DNA-binding MarR family transcriptional regulator